MKVTELKEQLRRLQQPVSGTKAVLQERLKAALLETPVSLGSVKPVGSSAGASAAAADDGEEDDEDQILPLGEGEEAPPARPKRAAAAAGRGRQREVESWAEREEPDYRATGGRGGGWRADEEEWEDAAEDGVELGQEMEAEVGGFWGVWVGFGCRDHWMG